MTCDRNDVENVNVYLGLGIYLQMSLSDGRLFLQNRKHILQQKRDALIERANHIKAHIRLVYEVSETCDSLHVISRFSSDRDFEKFKTCPQIRAKSANVRKMIIKSVYSVIG